MLIYRQKPPFYKLSQSVTLIVTLSHCHKVSQIEQRTPNELRETRERPHNCACSSWEYNYTITAVNANNAPFCTCMNIPMTTMYNFNVCINCVKVFDALVTIPLHNVRKSNGRYLYTKAHFHFRNVLYFFIQSLLYSLHF